MEQLFMDLNSSVCLITEKEHGLSRNDNLVKVMSGGTLLRSYYCG